MFTFTNSLDKYLLSKNDMSCVLPEKSARVSPCWTPNTQRDCLSENSLDWPLGGDTGGGGGDGAARPPAWPLLRFHKMDLSPNRHRALPCVTWAHVFVHVVHGKMRSPFFFILNVTSLIAGDYKFETPLRVTNCQVFPSRRASEQQGTAIPSGRAHLAGAQDGECVALLSVKRCLVKGEGAALSL